MTTEKSRRRFEEGLKKYNLTLEEIQDGPWQYIGGNQGRHCEYYKLIYGWEPELDHEWVGECVCGHEITENCYISNGDETLILGNCCIKRFVPKSGRTCELCSKPHKNRIVDRCNDCRKGRCDLCFTSIKPSYKICFSCKFK